jgi:predicted phage terminase large subunit-like protein
MLSSNPLLADPRVRSLLLRKRDEFKREREARQAARQATTLGPARSEDETIDLDEAATQEIQQNFWAFRLYMNPKLKRGWFQEEVAGELQCFHEDLIAGARPKLVITAPPQHGKSLLIIDFIAWVSGKNPDLKTIYGSFSERLGVRANLRLQRTIDSAKYKRVFPDTRLNDRHVAMLTTTQYLRNHSILEFVGQEGSFRNTTIMGQINGEGLDLGVIDDPIKGREAAASLAIRDKTWDWFTDDFFTRFSEEAGLLAILTRWHLDDPIGRLELIDPTVRVLKYRAIAEQDEAHRKKGEALFPAHKSFAFLMERKKTMLNSSWLSLYQQSPIAAEGNLFKVGKIKLVPHIPGKVVRSVRYWDKAATEGGGAYTAGVLMHLLDDGSFCVSHVIRGQWSVGTREGNIKIYATIDGRKVRQWVEQEPGGAGKESAEATIRNLAGLSVRADPVGADKVTRAEPFAVQVEGSNVSVVIGPWNKDYIEELRLFPFGKFKDQVDASSGAFNKLAAGGLDYRQLVAAY